MANYKVLNICGNDILVSYSTPVAYMDAGGIRYVTKQKYSITTSRHINKWLSGAPSTAVEQSILNAVYKGDVDEKRT